MKPIRSCFSFLDAGRRYFVFNLALVRLLQLVDGAGDGLGANFSDVGVDRRCLQPLVPQQLLDEPYIGTIFKQMRRKRVAE